MKRTDFFRKIATAVIALLFCQPATFGQTYRRIAGWPDETNRRIESFLNSTLAMKERKVAVFDCDGTLIGQTPHYLSEESMYDFAVANYKDRQDKLSKEKWKICEELAAGDNVAVSYTQRCIDFFAGLTPDELSNAGWVCYQNKFAGKFYPEMKELLANLEEYGFEIWIVTASTELLYQRFVHEQLGIPVDRILGVKSCIRDGIVTDEVVRPIPQDAGKAEVIHTFIKARPLIVGGNSRGDMEMMHESVGRPENTGQSRRRETRASYGRKDRQIILGERSDDADRRKRRPPRRKHRMDDRETRRCPQSVASEALTIFPRKSEKRFGNRFRAVPESFLYTLSNILSTTADGRQKTAEIRPDRIFRRIPVRAFDKSAGTSEKI